MRYLEMAQYIQVVEDESDEPVEIPSEGDGTLLLTTLWAQFPTACGLKYRNPDSGAFRGIRLLDGVLHPPDGVWGNHQYLAVFPKENKRKGEDGYDNPVAKTKRLDRQKCSDLIVLGLPWKSTEDDLTKYFQQFGELVLVQVKRDIKSGQSKGFGFIRFSSYESQVKCCSQRHMIDGRWCDVTIPNSREGNKQMMNRKVFIGRVTEDIAADDLRSYFSKFGEVVDVFIPKPYRAFAFVTFADAETAQCLCGEDHIIKGASVHVSSAAPKSFEKGVERKGFGPGGVSGGGGGGYNQGGGWGQGRGAPGPVGGKAPNGADPMGGNIGMNLLNSAMLAAAQAMLQNQGGWGGMSQGPAQGGTGGNMGGGDHQVQPAMGNQGGFGTMGGGTGGGGSGGNWWGNEASSTSGGGHYGGWGGGSHGGRGSGGWS
uniref:TAR DNA-binding protein 43 n=2 Tax=Arion vulgaris TaxID=1028688 RepID=A0A0B6ZM06_9EUPU